MQEWLNWPAWKASKPQKGFRGSNPLLSAAETRMRTGQQPVRIFHPDTLWAQQPLRAATAENRQSARNSIRKSPVRRYNRPAGLFQLDVHAGVGSFASKPNEMKRKLLIGFIALLGWQMAAAQDTTKVWTLRECLDHALETTSSCDRAATRCSRESKTRRRPVRHSSPR